MESRRGGLPMSSGTGGSANERSRMGRWTVTSGEIHEDAEPFEELAAHAKATPEQEAQIRKQSGVFLELADLREVKRELKQLCAGRPDLRVRMVRAFPTDWYECYDVRPPEFAWWRVEVQGQSKESGGWHNLFAVFANGLCYETPFEVCGWETCSLAFANNELHAYERHWCPLREYENANFREDGKRWDDGGKNCAVCTRELSEAESARVETDSGPLCAECWLKAGDAYIIARAAAHMTAAEEL